MSSLEKTIKKIDNARLEFVGPFLILLILSPILYLYYRDGAGSGIFPFHDQLDETILNYYFSAKYLGKSVYDNMFFGGIPATSLKPFCPIFVPLYRFFSIYTAYLFQHIIVITTAYYGMYFCLKKVFNAGSIASVLAAFLFAFLPVHSIYGNVAAGTPLLILCIFLSNKKENAPKVLPYIGVLYYALSTSFSLVGWCACALLLCYFIVENVRKKEFQKGLFISFLVLAVTYILCNLDLIGEVLGIGSFESHREEFVREGAAISFLDILKSLLFSGDYSYEVQTRHLLVYPALAAALVIMFVTRTYKKYAKTLIVIVVSLIGIILLTALFQSSVVLRLQEKVGGMIASFQFQRFHYFLPGLWYILLGYCLSLIIESFNEKICFIGILSALGLSFMCLYYLAKDKDGIFYQNINQINNGQQVTGYLTMRNIYSENLMKRIEEDLDKPKESYRVLHIGISPVVSLVNGFYTLDGYSNNYPLEYKHKFREIIAGELEKNEYNKAYFDNWGSRCYAFYHEWGNAYLLGKSFSGTINDLNLDFDKLKEMDCKYIFSAAEIEEYSSYELEFIGTYEDSESYWEIYVYEVK